jgi:hypothetical protein
MSVLLYHTTIQGYLIVLWVVFFFQLLFVMVCLAWAFVIVAGRFASVRYLNKNYLS